MAGKCKVVGLSLNQTASFKWSMIQTQAKETIYTCLLNVYRDQASARKV